ncbi:MAG TPA: TIM barrel protein [Propionibacteriaceae bacterium]
MGFTLAACAEMLFTDLPVLERVRRIHALGFQVELWDWTRHDIAALATTGATFSSMTGYVTGDLIDDDGADELLATAARSVPVAHQLGIPRLNLHGTGLDGNGLPIKPIAVVTGEMWLKAQRTLTRIAELGHRHGVTFVLENLNTAVDHPGTPFARAEDTLALVAAVDHPNLRLMLDVYHAQIGEGNLIELIHRCAPYLGEVQVADVPGRCEPGTGEINYPAIAAALTGVGYVGTVGLEAWASGDSEVALERFRIAFGG